MPRPAKQPIHVYPHYELYTCVMMVEFMDQPIVAVELSNERVANFHVFNQIKLPNLRDPNG